MSDSQRRTLRILCIALAIATAVIVAPYWAPVLLAVWAADLLRPAVRWLERILGGRRRSAAAIVVVLAAALVVPLAALIAAVIVGVRELVVQLGYGAGVETLGASLPGGREWADLVRRHGADAWRAATVVTHASASALLAFLVFVVTLYAVAASGDRTYRWLARRSPLPPRVLTRMTRAFRETGRGLLIGGGGTALTQGLLATIGYVALGIPHALLLGPLTALCALVPLVGTALVWAPLAIQMAISGHYVRATVLVGVGIGVSVIDNVIRPVLTRYGRLALPMPVVLVSMLGGLALLGPAGALVGPLVVRLTVEALAVMRDESWPARGATRARPSPRTTYAATLDAPRTA